MAHPPISALAQREPSGNRSVGGRLGGIGAGVTGMDTGGLGHKMPANRFNQSLLKPFVVLAVPGMYLVYKYNQFKRQQQENSRRKTAEKELAHLNQKIVSTSVHVLPMPVVFFPFVSCIYRLVITLARVGCVLAFGSDDSCHTGKKARANFP